MKKIIFALESIEKDIMVLKEMLKNEYLDKEEPHD